MWKASLCLFLLFSAISHAEDKPARLDPDVANRNLTNKVEPAVPPLAKAAGIGGTVVADITIDPTGKVISVRLISGHPMLAPAFLDAVQKRQYRPFLNEGKPVSIVTRVEWTVASPKYSQSQEQALDDYYPAFRSCYDLLKQGKDAEAERKCRETLALSDQLPDNRILERSDARVFLAHALFRQRKFNDSLPLYEESVEIRKAEEHSDRDADFASENASLARAYAAVGRLPDSDAYYARSVTIYKAAIVDLPSMKDNYTARLKSTLTEYAKVKTALGEKEDAARLEKEAAAL
jgi:TonB family protein